LSDEELNEVIEEVGVRMGVVRGDFTNFVENQIV